MDLDWCMCPINGLTSFYQIPLYIRSSKFLRAPRKRELYPKGQCTNQCLQLHIRNIQDHMVHIINRMDFSCPDLHAADDWIFHHRGTWHSLYLLSSIAGQPSSVTSPPPLQEVTFVKWRSSGLKKDFIGSIFRYLFHSSRHLFYVRRLAPLQFG